MNVLEKGWNENGLHLIFYTNDIFAANYSKMQMLFMDQFNLVVVDVGQEVYYLMGISVRE